MKKTIVHLSSRYSFHGSFVSSKRFFNFLQNDKKLINIYLTARIDEEFKNDVRYITPFHNIFTYKLFHYFDKLINYFFHKKITKSYWSNSKISYFDISNIEVLKKADLIFLYWVNDGFLSLKNINDILNLGKPVIWRFSDMWPFTGGCHYAFNCNQYKSSCIKCPQLSKRYLNNLSYNNFKIKKKWKLDNLTIISPSSYLEKTIKQSYLFKNVKVKKILNSVDIKNFKPLKKNNKQFRILVGPFNSQDKIRKGYDLFVKLLNYIKQKKLDIKFETFGTFKHHDESNLVKNNGFIKKKDLSKLYAKSDVYLFLSKGDNSPNTIAESLSCGTPIITFKNNGTDDYCINDYNSFVLKEFNEEKIFELLNKILNKKINIKLKSINARLFAKKHLSDNSISKKLNRLVNETIENKYIK